MTEWQDIWTFPGGIYDDAPDIDLWTRTRKNNAMTEWQPIKTAPNASAHKKVWVFGGRYDEPTIVPSDGDFWRYESKNGMKSLPTHWMELHIPNPPE